MSTKTPEQIAAELVYDSGNIEDGEKRFSLAAGDVTVYGIPAPTADAIRRVIVKGIEADRIQREAERTEPSRTRFQVGALVKLTGESWNEYELRYEVVRVGVSYSEDEGPVNVFTLDGKQYAIFQNEHDDYSASPIVGINE